MILRVHQDMQGAALTRQLPRCALPWSCTRPGSNPPLPTFPVPQIAILLAAPADSTVQVRRRGHLLTCAEFVSQLYRMLPPAPLWYAFYTAQAAVPALLRTGLSGAYLLVSGSCQVIGGNQRCLLAAKLQSTAAPCHCHCHRPAAAADQGAALFRARRTGGAGGAAVRAAIVWQYPQRGGAAGGGQLLPHLPGAPACP